MGCGLRPGCSLGTSPTLPLDMEVGGDGRSADSRLSGTGARLTKVWLITISLKGIATSISPDRTRLISILLSNSRLPGHLSPDLWHSMLIILILLIHATTRQQ